MATADVRGKDGTTSRTIELDESYFGIQPNVPVMHQVVTAQLAAARAGTQSTLTRSEVRGGGAKPWRQKGTGRARQGSIRAPHWQGGGVALGPKPRDYRQKTPKKMVQLALRSALSDRASAGKVVVLENLAFDAPKTKDAVALLKGLGLEGKVLIVLDREDHNTYKSFRNLEVQLMLRPELNAYDVLCNDWIVFTESTLPRKDSAEAGSGSAGPAAAPSSSTERSEASEVER